MTEVEKVLAGRFDEGDYLTGHGNGVRRAIMADLDRATNAELFVWRDGQPAPLGRPWGNSGTCIT